MDRRLPSLPVGWNALLAAEMQQSYYRELESFLDEERRAGQVVLPPVPDIFRALHATPPERVKVVILGQDPYPTPGHAHGLCFSVQESVHPLPRSLKNVFRELRDDVGFREPNHGCLESWARQGVLLLNTVMTVRAGVPQSHQKRGWETFTDRILEIVDARPSRVVFLLWGNSARQKRALIRQPHHVVLEAGHPSPLSVRFFLGCRAFSKANAALIEAGLSPVDWAIPDVASRRETPSLF